MKRAVVYGVFSFAAVTAALYAGLFGSWQEALLDRFYVADEPVEKIIIIAIDDQSLSELGRWPWDRGLFADVLPKLEGARAVGFDINFSEPSADDEILASAFDAFSKPIVLPVEISESGRRTLVEPLPIFQRSARLGSISVPIALGGVVRESFGGMTFPQALSGGEAARESRFRVAYVGPQKTFPTLSFVDLVEGRVPPSVVEDAYIIVGATAADLHDLVETPFGSMSGAEYHANVLHTILTDGYFNTLPLGYTYPLVALLALAGSFFVTRVRRTWLLVTGILGGALLILVLSAAFFEFGIVLPALYMLLAWLLASGLSLIGAYVFESRQKKFIRDTFRHYLNAEVVDELLKKPELVTLGGEERVLSILFSDIRGFTSLSESLGPHELTTLLNEYLNTMTEAILSRRGVLDKYIGDAIMAFWGAPLAEARHSALACKAALGMMEKLEEFNKGSAHRLEIGIGINTGEAVVGNMGSHIRFDYTVIGDEVNLASRLEGLTKYYGVSCIVSESTYRSASARDEGLLFRELDRVRVKGRSEPLVLYELSLRPVGAANAHFQKGREHYFKGDWNDAIREFAKAGDGPGALFVKRCEEFKKNPPSGWDGIYTFDQK